VTPSLGAAPETEAKRRWLRRGVAVIVVILDEKTMRNTVIDRSSCKTVENIHETGVRRRLRLESWFGGLPKSPLCRR
jgi:hypothetical protein